MASAARAQQHPQRAGLRERKKAATRAGLREAAVRLGRDLGPTAVTVDEICAAVEVSPRTFFNYFATKDDAFFGADPDQLTAITARVADRPAGEDPLDAVAAVLADIVDDATGSTIWHEQLLLLREYPQLLPRLHASTRATETALAEGVALRTGRAVAEPYVLTVAAVAMAAVRVAITVWLDSPDGSDPRRLLGDIVGTIRAGLTPAAAV